MRGVAQPLVKKPTPNRVDTAPSGVCEQYRHIVSKYKWNQSIALAVMKAESGCNPNAYNGSNTNGTNDAGLFQINSLHVRSGLIANQQRFEPEANVKAAYSIYMGSGWSAWSAYNNNSYKKFI